MSATAASSSRRRASESPSRVIRHHRLRELYLAAVLDRAAKRVLFMGSGIAIYHSIDSLLAATNGPHPINLISVGVLLAACHAACVPSGRNEPPQNVGRSRFSRAIRT